MFAYDSCVVLLSLLAYELLAYMGIADYSTAVPLLVISTATGMCGSICFSFVLNSLNVCI